MRASEGPSERGRKGEWEGPAGREGGSVCFCIVLAVNGELPVREQVSQRSGKLPVMLLGLACFAVVAAAFTQPVAALTHFGSLSLL